MLIKRYIVVIATLTLAPSVTARRDQSWRRPYLQKDNLFETERIPQMRTLIPGSSLFDVGTCPVGSCAMKSYLTYFGCPDDGYICPVKETRRADLGALGGREYQYVTKCVCCKDLGVPVKVHVIDSKSEKSLRRISIHFNGKLKKKTGDDGILESSVDSTERSLTINAKDLVNNAYLEAVRVVEIAKGYRGPIDVTLYMIMKAKAVEIDSTKGTELSLSADPTNTGIGNAAIVFDANSFIGEDGSEYNGQVQASITVLDPNDESNLFPGNFLTYGPTTGRPENLVSDGIFAFDFADDNGGKLTLNKSVTVKVKDDMDIWSMNSVSGLWELVKYDPSDGRKKRQTDFTRELLVEFANGRWYNIDVIYNAPRCYFKARIFDEINGIEIESSPTASFKPDIIAKTNTDRPLKFYYASTSAPSDTCFEVRCPVEDDQYDPLIGFIGMVSIESISVGNTNVPHITRLRPENLLGYSPTHWSDLNDVEYEITSGGQDVFVKFLSNAGPFYSSQNACENSTEDKPDLLFFKPDLPDYAEEPDINSCSARLVFRDVGNFYFYIENSSYLPNVTAISIWEEDGQTYHHTYTAQLQQSDDTPEDYFVFVCLNYRCSETGEPTIVYLDIDIPSNNTEYDDNMNEFGENYTFSEFRCFGNCVGPLCPTDDRERSVNNRAFGIEGSFEAPVEVGAGPDFFDFESSNECNAQIAPSEDFAYEFNCYALSQNQGGNFA